MDDITKLGKLAMLQGQLGAKKAAAMEPKKIDKAFGDVLKDSIEGVSDLQNKADKAIADLVKGDVKDVHQTMIALKKADLSLKLMMQVRSKILEAYQEVMRQQG